MNEVPIPFIPALFVTTFAVAQLGWQIALIVFVWKIWTKVRHLPG